MRLPQHDRYDFSPINQRPNYSWPDGKKLAFYLALNVEHYAFGQGAGHLLGAEGPPPDHRNFCWRDYGNRVGVWRLLELFDDLGLPACHLVNSAVYEYFPQVLSAIRERGDEIIAHGRTNSERQGLMWEDDERRLISEVVDTISSHESKRPRGWMGPWMSQSRTTPDILKEQGFTFLMDWPCDDQPMWLRTRGGPLLSIPYPLELNDSPQILIQHHTASEFCSMIIDQFEEMLRQSEKSPLVCGIALHTMIFGQPHRLHALRSALRHIADHPRRHEVWFTRPGEIADHVIGLPAGVVP